MRLVLVVLLLVLGPLSPKSGFAEDRLDLSTLYKVTMLRAAPGELENLITYLRDLEHDGFYGRASETAPMIMRHSQGDHWDLFLLQPIGSYKTYFGGSDAAPREEVTGEITARKMAIDRLAVFRGELFAYGPHQETVQSLFDENGLFHLELFAALAGKHDELLDQRVRENGYITTTGGRPNLIFVGDMGSDIDVFTIGFYADLEAFAAPSSASAEEKDRAAQENGFKSRNHLGFNLREFLAYHNDTLATKVAYED